MISRKSYRIVEFMRLIPLAIPVVLAISSALLAEQEPDARSPHPTFEKATVPARFARGLEAAAAGIPFPDYRKDLALYINCAARLDESGRLESHFCLDYSGSADDQFRGLVDRFIREASISPALVEGVPVPVEMYFRVYFGRRGDMYAVGIFPNWGDDVDDYGPEYEAPQRYDREPMSSACAIDGGMARIKVGADGRAIGDASLIMSYGIPGRYSDCEIWFSQSVASGSYIPGMHEGRPVATTYVEMTGDPDWLRLKRPDGL